MAYRFLLFEFQEIVAVKLDETEKRALKIEVSELKKKNKEVRLSIP